VLLSLCDRKYLDGRIGQVSDVKEVACGVRAVKETVECGDVWIAGAFAHGHRHRSVVASNLPATTYIRTPEMHSLINLLSKYHMCSVWSKHSAN